MADLHDALRNDDGEVVVTLAGGWSLRSGCSPEAGDFVSGEYVRLCRPDGEEHLYWDHHEWQVDPILVMGAIINSAAGLIVERSGQCFRCGTPVIEQVLVEAVDGVGRTDCPESEDGLPHEIDPPDGWDDD